ncbi:MAG: glutamine amidotransferase [Armatimonadota bacterium]
MIVFLCVLLFTLLPACADPVKPPSQVTITDDGMTWYNPPEKPELRHGNRLFRFETGGQPHYGLRLSVSQKKGADGVWVTTGTSVGMPVPTEANWYHSGFLGFAANGKPVTITDPRVEVVETGKLGILDFTWEDTLVVIRARFIAEPDTDRLLLELRWEPTPELKTLIAGFNCYPQGYRVSEPDRLQGKSLERHVYTAERDLPQVQKATLNLPAEWWQIYADQTLEKSPTYHPGGPCGLAFPPEDVQKFTVNIGGYTVSPVAELNPAGGRARFMLWDYSGKSIAAARKLMTEQAPALRERMLRGAWLPTTLSALNIAAEKVRVNGLAKALAKTGAVKIAGLRAQLAALSGMQAALASSTKPLKAESELRAALTQYRIAYWRAERPTRQRVRALLLCGPFAYTWKIEPAMNLAWGSDAVKRGGYSWKYWAGHFITYFPSTVEELLGYDVVILADIPQDPLTPDKRQLLADFVKWGGGMLTLGGTYTYGSGGWKDSPLEPLLPVQIGGVFDLAKSDGSAALALTAAGTKRLGKFTRPLGMVPWRNAVTPRKGTEVWLVAGSAPFAVAGKAGDGRVIAILGTGLGEAPAGQTAFWDSPGWPYLLQRLLMYLTTGK